MSRAARLSLPPPSTHVAGFPLQPATRQPAVPDVAPALRRTKRGASFIENSRPASYRHACCHPPIGRTPCGYPMGARSAYIGLRYAPPDLARAPTGAVCVSMLAAVTARATHVAPAHTARTGQRLFAGRYQQVVATRPTASTICNT